MIHRVESLRKPGVAIVLVSFLLNLGLVNLGFGQQSNLTLVDGMILGPGVTTQIQTLSLAGSVNANREVSSLPITVMFDGLRRTHVNINRVTGNAQVDGQVKIQFEGNEKQKADGVPRITSMPGFGEITQFDIFGRRYYLYSSPKGIVKFVQGITEATPSYIKVESLRVERNAFELDMRLSLSNIDSLTLKNILVKNADPNKAKDWLDIVSLFSQAERFLEARTMLVEAIHKFPELENQASQLKQFDQLMADKLFVFAQAAQVAGQHNFSKHILENVNDPKLSLETKSKAERRLQTLATEQKEREELLTWIRDDVAKLPEGDDKVQALSIVTEIGENLSPDTTVRFADYRRRRTDATLKPDQIAALAISGWIYGPSIGESNSSVVMSGVRARRLIKEYLSAPSKNDQIIEQLTRLESGSPRLVAKILEQMAPPVQTPESVGVSKTVMTGNTTQPTKEMTIPGRYLLEVPKIGKDIGKTTRYMVQLPPEYNPYRRYPCVLTLPSEISTMEQQLEWWVGMFAPESKRCLGEASRRGYIVVSPEWPEPKQPTYNFTENEHSAVLTPLRDAMKRFNIDSDRVFLSGHFMGGTAAWDIALAHPDLWAGCIVVGGKASKHIIQYHRENSVYVPTYFVAGELDPGTIDNGSVWDNYMERKQIDCLISIYQGRGLDHFQEELPKIMDWMSLSKVRNLPVKDFSAATAREGDRFFWWFETDQLNTEKLVHPLLPLKAGGKYMIKSSINRDANTISMDTVPARKYTIWLAPDFLDFSRIITVDKRRIDPKPDLRVMLEDVRGRSDRQHPFWMRADFPK